MSEAPRPGAVSAPTESDTGPLRPIAGTGHDTADPLAGLVLPPLRRAPLSPTVFGGVSILLRNTVRVVIERPRATLWTAIALIASLFSAGIATVAATNLDTWTREPAGRASVVVYLAAAVDATRGAAMADELSRQRWIDRVEYVPAVETARRLEAALGYDATARPEAPRGDGRASQPQLLDGVDLAGLPSTIELTLAPGVRDVVAMSPTARGLRDMPGVDDVVVENGGEDRAANALASVRVVGWSAGMVVLGLGLVVVLATIRLWLDRGHRELAIARMLGAGPSYVAVPCALAGLVLGTFAATLAAVLIYAAVSTYGDGVAATLAPALGTIEVAVPAVGDLVLAVGAVAALGLIAGSLAGIGWTGAPRTCSPGGVRAPR